MDTISPATGGSALPARTADEHGQIEIYRHRLPVRIFHWINLACFIILLGSGLQIFNYHPRLYWGHTGYWDTPAWLEISGAANARTIQGDQSYSAGEQASWIGIGGHRINVTGIMGQPQDIAMRGGAVNVAFPSWSTLPGAPFDLARGRGWHFLTLYVFAFNLAFYMVWGFWSGKFRWLRPNRDQLRPSAIARDLWMHMRLKHATGADAARYNLLQKLSYIAVLFVLMPTMILSGMTMSPSSLAAYPWLIDLFAGRQSARTIHFLCATFLVLFVLVHVFQVFVAGFVNEMRSMITGKYRIPESHP